MSKEETRIGDINMSNIGGQVFLRRFNDVVANLSLAIRIEKKLPMLSVLPKMQ
jgi:hypothetical protein